MEMEASKNLFFLCLLMSTTASQPEFEAYSCSNNGNYSSNSIYKQNLHSLLSSIVSNTKIDYGFYNFTAGQEPNKLNAIALCRGDWSMDQCRRCVNDSAREIVEVCPNQKEAIGWYDDCMLRYSDSSIFSVGNDEVLSPYYYNTWNASDIDGFTRALRSLFEKLRNEASSGNSTHKFAVGEIAAPNLDTIYGFVLCTPDLTYMDCDNCLIETVATIPMGTIGASIFAVSCALRFEIYHFFNLSTPRPPPPPPPPSNHAPSPPLLSPPQPHPTPGNSGNTAETVIIVVVSMVAAIILVGICIILRIRKGKHKRPSEHFESVALGEAMDEISSVETIQFDFLTIKIATNNFSIENKLGQGGFGAVYRGKLSDGRSIAVKRLLRNSEQGDLEFKNEVLLVAKLQHRNLVQLLGFCLHGSERLLIYEFVPNGSLDRFIFDFGKQALLDWTRRYKIIGGIARGLLYLHEDSRLRVIHRDLKASNILLDEELNPKIADFGAARLFEIDESQGNTKKVVGTYGYKAPEYVIFGQFSTKLDVFSFGVLVLEIMTGKKNTCFRNGDENVEDLLSLAWKNWRAGTTLNIIDPTLNAGSRIEMMRFIHIALLCVQDNVANRPTMALVLLMFNSFSITLPIPSEPAFFMYNKMDESNTLLKLNRWSKMTQTNHFESTLLPPSENEASITELHPR